MRLKVELTEQEWDGQLFRSDKSLARMCGWTSYHVLRSKGSRAGFPDRVCWRERVIYVELKSDTGKLTAAQEATLTALAKAGAECYLWRPADLEEVGRVLGHRWRWSGTALYRVGTQPVSWTPGSLWLPSAGRAGDGQTA